MPSRRRWAGRSSTGAPSSSTSPSPARPAGSTPVSQASRLDLPAPEGPMTVNGRPGAIRQVNGANNLSSPRRMVTSRSSSIAPSNQRRARGPATNRIGGEDAGPDHQRLGRAVDPNDAAVAAGRQRDGFGREGRDPAAAG